MPFKKYLFFYLALPADSTNGTKIALSCEDRTPLINDASGSVLAKAMSTPIDKKIKEAISQSTNISFITSEAGNYCESRTGNISASGPSSRTNPSLMSNQPLILPRPQGSNTALDQQDAYRRRSSNNSNASNDLPKLSLIGAYGHPARLGGPRMPLRSQGPIHWHGSRM